MENGEIVLGCVTSFVTFSTRGKKTVHVDALFWTTKTHAEPVVPCSCCPQARDVSSPRLRGNQESKMLRAALRGSQKAAWVGLWVCVVVPWYVLFVLMPRVYVECALAVASRPRARDACLLFR